MARNRIIYQNEGLFIGPGTDFISDSAVDADVKIQGNLDKVQSIGYSYEISRSDISVLGKGSTVDRPINSNPSVSLQIDYLLSSFTNEYLFGFGMTPTNISARFPMLPDEYLNKSGIANEVDRYNDRRNFYLATTKDGLDLLGSVTGDIEGVLCFDNCQLTNYTANFEVNNIPSASVTVVGTDSNYYSKPSMDVPLRNKKTGAVTETFTVDIPTGSDGLTDFKNRAPEILLPGDISIKIKRNKIDIPGHVGEPDIETPKDIFDLQNNKVQTFSVELPLERSSIDLPGYKMNYDKILNFPIMSSVSMSIIEDGGQTGILADFIDKDLEYNVNVSIRDQSKSVVLAYDFLKVRFNSVAYSHDIGENKASDVSFSCSLDPVDNEKGMFISGVVY